jgi:hypothetical protein
MITPRGWLSSRVVVVVVVEVDQVTRFGGVGRTFVYMVSIGGRACSGVQPQ